MVNIYRWVTHGGLFPILVLQQIYVNLVTQLSLLLCLVRKTGTKHLIHFDFSLFIPLGTVEVGLGCVGKYDCCPCLYDHGVPIQRRRTCLIRLIVESLSVVPSSLEIFSDMIQFFFVRSGILSVASRGCSIRCTYHVGSPIIPS